MRGSDITTERRPCTRAERATGAPRRGRRSLAVSAALALVAFACGAGWPSDPSTNLAVCTADISQDDPQIVSDGEGGAFIAWQATIPTGQARIFVQRVGRDGRLLWGDEGVAVCTETSGQMQPALAADSAGGAIVAWQDDRAGGNWDIYAQRIDRDGVLRWAPAGARVSSAPDDQLAPVIAADSRGGALIGWQDLRAGQEADVYAQALDAGGRARWSPDGAPVFAGPGAPLLAQVVPASAAGATFLWMDSRGDPESSGLYAQRVDSVGNVRWDPNGVLVVDGIAANSHPVVCGAEGGAILVAWESATIGAQRLDDAGRPTWGAGGVALSSLAGRAPALVTDGAGGAIAVWQASTLDEDASFLRAQAVRASGTLRWGNDGIRVSRASGTQAEVVAVPAPAGGAIVLWRDARNDPFGDFYGQRLDSTGAARWRPDGVLVSSATGLQDGLVACTDGAGGAIAAWADNRSGRHLYAQRVDVSGRLGPAAGRRTGTPPGH